MIEDVLLAQGADQCRQDTGCLFARIDRGIAQDAPLPLNCADIRRFWVENPPACAMIQLPSTPDALEFSRFSMAAESRGITYAIAARAV